MHVMMNYEGFILLFLLEMASEFKKYTKPNTTENNMAGK